MIGCPKGTRISSAALLIFGLPWGLLDGQIQFEAFGSESTIHKGISGDGQVVAGSLESETFDGVFYHRSGELIHIDNPDGIELIRINDLSQDGRLMVGTAYVNERHQGFLWENGAITLLDKSETGHNSSAAAISADGSTIVGISFNRDTNAGHAVRWVQGELQSLKSLPGYEFTAEAMDVSADGSIIVGWCASETERRACRWVDGQVHDLGPGTACGISADGTTVVGTEGYSGSSNQAFPAPPTDDTRAFMWKEGKLSILETFPEKTETVALQTSADGSIVVGWTRRGYAGQSPVFWAEETAYQPVSLYDYLRINDSLANESLLSITGVSDDGRTLVGSGYRPTSPFSGTNGSLAYVAHLPERFTWGGTLIYNGYIDTDCWLGWLEVTDAPWSYHQDSGMWIFLPEDVVRASSGWIYVPNSTDR